MKNLALLGEHLCILHLFIQQLFLEHSRFSGTQVEATIASKKSLSLGILCSGGQLSTGVAWLSFG